jgi:hypothetical protein
MSPLRGTTVEQISATLIFACDGDRRTKQDNAWQISDAQQDNRQPVYFPFCTVAVCGHFVHD